jgi:hypothetical protein
MQSSFAKHVATPGDLRIDVRAAQEIVKLLETMGYWVRPTQRNSGPISGPAQATTARIMGSCGNKNQKMRGISK